MQYSAVVTSAMLSALTMPFILNFAHKRKLYDIAGGRKNHNGNIPRLGGLGMFLAFVAMVTAFSIMQTGPVSRELWSRGDKLWPFAVGAVLMHTIGLMDDLKAQPAPLKLGVQVLAALVVALAGYRFRGFGFRADILTESWSWLSIILSVGWIVGVANAINFIDGLDGLAGSISFIAAMAFGIFYYQSGDASSSFLCLSVAGAAVGFLFFNFPAPKAKIFMGDSGSLFLGFCLAVMPFLGQAQAGTTLETLPGGNPIPTLGLIPSITLLGLPVFDTLRVIALRVRNGVSPMKPDRQHIHYLFADSGYRPLAVLGVLDATAIMLAAAVFLAASMPQSLGYLLMLISIGILCIVFRYAMSLKPAKAR
jgi:UDP-GlcNAc:undecaprenyl-phosphate GlcNAc-1-phosphate transferase